jgi:hypothetical protein
MMIRPQEMALIGHRKGSMFVFWTHQFLGVQYIWVIAIILILKLIPRAYFIIDNLVFLEDTKGGLLKQELYRLRGVLNQPRNGKWIVVDCPFGFPRLLLVEIVSSRKSLYKYMGMDQCRKKMEKKHMPFLGGEHRLASYLGYRVLTYPHLNTVKSC